ncbi:STM4012 family radical SAM protein [Eleftheria terrae]|uniref:STM4012 family radical SAM protein n=1 Tax=Eleftheria terrae TaxID=1597781 RepID=UPI00263BA7ED|nr:STM4012 family radical SAM protein [Eleftheria terrae]WKB51842.1 STM4012 family radical SAM protein [Eleftheria terrae]
MPAPASLADLIAHGPYQAYSYSYPHKQAYRRLDTPRPLAPLWAAEDRRALFAYLHIPFCTMRCGFCNLFAMARPDEDLVQRYVDALVRQMRVMDGVLGGRRFARLALGGGTPTYLSPAQLETLFTAAERHLGIALQATPSGIEASPETVTDERLAVCKAMGVDRVSLGIQSFAADEMRALARPQQNPVVVQAIERIRRAGFPVLNLDLIYGIEGQTRSSLLASIDSALAFAPEELYLYPLYVRGQTGLGKLALRRDSAPADSRLDLYAAARDHLRAAGYTQVSMRMFRAPHAPGDSGPAYCCQDDGMVGLGAGARSYTRGLHYSGAYAVERSATRDIVQAYVEQDEAGFAQAAHGFELDAQEQRRRYAIQSLLTRPGLSHAAWRQRFGSDCLDDLPQLRELQPLGLAQDANGLLALTDRGLAYADTIGPWLVSARVRALMAEHGPAC